MKKVAVEGAQHLDDSSEAVTGQNTAGASRARAGEGSKGMAKTGSGNHSQKERVSDYPRPPALEPTWKHIRVEFGGIVLADTHSAFRVLETNHPPVYYIPPAHVATEYLFETPGNSFCEWKGIAGYYGVGVGGERLAKVAWFYADPTPAFRAIRDHIAFYPSKMDDCFVDGERVGSQPGDFYGGWITSDLVGPFKGGPGTQGW